MPDTPPAPAGPPTDAADATAPARPGIDPAPHGRCAWDERPLPPATGKRTRADTLATQPAAAQDDGRRARAETDAVRAELDELRHTGDEQLRALRTQLDDARAQGATSATELVRLQTLHEAAQDRITDLRGQGDDLKAQREALRAEVRELRARLDSATTRPGAEE
ncbi:hypothetical protein ACQPYK_29235 [Streptosporangium sp. CA-135522]|uniref:hypothetical protein n=1 Tax=Streptosporangium sp. CA-135522 TaxID=3240072 RepID=UPI003D8C8D77